MQRFLLKLVVFLACSVDASYLNAQADTQSATFLAAALKAVEAVPIKDVKLTASVRRIAGSMDETGTATYEALSSGSTQSVVQTSTGPLTEIRAWSANGVRTGTWVDQQGKSHTMAYHNMMVEPSWFFPTLTLARALDASSGFTISYVGLETFHGTSVQHLRIATTNLSTPLITALSQTELYLNALTLQPAGLAYNDHPDNTALVNIPIEVVFSGYQLLGGILLPTDIEQYRNNALAQAVTVQSAVINTGLTITPTAE